MSAIDPRVERILKKVPGLPPGTPVVAFLEGGITNRNYRVELGHHVLVVRIGGENTNLLGIDRRREHAASMAAAHVGVGAEVIAFVEEESAMLTRFIAGRRVTREAANEPAMLKRIVDSLHLYHGGPAFFGVFSPFETVRSYGKIAGEHHVQFPEEAKAALEILAQIEAALGPIPKLVPCHNDLLAANFIDDGVKVRILDWEYAAMGDPYFDLGNFAANQDLDFPACEALLSHYVGQYTPRDLARLHLYRLSSDMREAYWGLLQVGISKLEFDYRDYARQHLQRFLARANVPELPRWLAEAGSAPA